MNSRCGRYFANSDLDYFCSLKTMSLLELCDRSGNLFHCCFCKLDHLLDSVVHLTAAFYFVLLFFCSKWSFSWSSQYCNTSDLMHCFPNVFLLILIDWQHFCYAIVECCLLSAVSLLKSLQSSLCNTLFFQDFTHQNFPLASVFNDSYCDSEFRNL